MPARILITYATGHGSTAGVAEVVAQTIRDAGVSAQVANVADAPAPDQFDAIIIGSAIRYDRWLPAAQRYVEANRSVLSTRSVACFLTCMALSKETGAAQGKAYSDKVAALCAPVRPVSIGRFAGALDFTNFPALQRPPARLLFSLLGVKSGDYRDFAAIRGWSSACLTAFKNSPKIKGN